MYGVMLNQNGNKTLAGGFETEEEATQLANQLAEQGYDCTINIINIQQSGEETGRSSGGMRPSRPSYFKPPRFKPHIARRRQ